MSDLLRIAKIEKNTETTIVFSLTEFKGNQYVDVREFLKSETYTGFTKKGLRFRADMLDTFISSLEKVRDVRDGKAQPPPQEEEETGEAEE
jgi:hypothetical protein